MPTETEVFQTFQGAQRCAKELAAKYRATISICRNADGTYSVDLTPVINIEDVLWQEGDWYLAQRERDEENRPAKDEDDVPPVEE